MAPAPAAAPFAAAARASASADGPTPAAAFELPQAGLHSPMSPAASLDSTSHAHPAMSVQSAVWCCFNPVLLDAAANEVTSLETALGQDHPLDYPHGALAPDALLDQIASAPGRMLFGQNQGQIAEAGVQGACPNGTLDGLTGGLSFDGANLWQSSAANLDLWDMLRTSASI